ncbi:MAG: esterase, partial [Mycobacteriaceae bacterium]|nr:esterase [Mycobacteriaceae bacterium]
EWLNRRVRSTPALLDTSTVKSLLDRPTARAVLSRFGATPPESDDDWSESSDDGADAPEVPRLGSFEVMNRTIDIAQSALARHTLAAYPPDLLIEVPRTTCRSLEFHRAVEVIAAGRTLATRALDAFENAAGDGAQTPALEG